MSNAQITNTVLERAQNFALNDFIDNVDFIRIGDDNTTPSPSNTDVINLIGSTGVLTTDESVAGQVTFGTRFGITDFVGDTSRELVISKGNITESYGRALTVEKLKGSDQIFWYRATVKVTAVNKTT